MKLVYKIINENILYKSSKYRSLILIKYIQKYLSQNKITLRILYRKCYAIIVLTG